MEQEKLSRALKREKLANQRLSLLEESNKKFVSERERKSNAIYKKEVKLEELRHKMEQADREKKAKEMQVMQQKMHLNAVSAHKNETEVAHLRKMLKLKQKEILDSNKTASKIKRKLDSSYIDYNKEYKKHSIRNLERLRSDGETYQSLESQSQRDFVNPANQPRSGRDDIYYEAPKRDSYDRRRYEPRYNDGANYNHRDDFERRSYDDDYRREIRQTETKLIDLRRREEEEKLRRRNEVFALEQRREEISRRKHELQLEEENVTRMINIKEMNRD